MKATHGITVLFATLLMVMVVVVGARVGFGERVGSGAKLQAVPLQGGGPYVLTQSLKLRSGDQATMSDSMDDITVSYQDENHFAVNSVATGNRPNAGTRTRTVRDGPKTVRETYLPGDVLKAQTFMEYNSSVPTIFRPDARATALELLMAPDVPAIDLGALGDLLADDLVSESGTETILGRVARVIDVPAENISGGSSFVIGHRVWVDSLTGLKLRTQTDKRKFVTQRREEVALAMPTALPPGALSTTLEPEKVQRADYSEEFDLGSGSYPSEAAGIVVPPPMEFGNGYEVHQAVFFSSTIRGGAGDLASGWVVAQQVQGTTGSGHEDAGALVIQSTDTTAVPAGIELYWPAFWDNPDPITLPDSLYESRVPVTLANGQAGYSLVLVDAGSVDPSRVPPEYKYVVTWLTAAGLRVVVAGNSQFDSEGEFVDMARALSAEL